MSKNKCTCPVPMPTITKIILVKKPPNIPHLEYQKKKALRNARRQRARIEQGFAVKVLPGFWDQVANDYQRQITSARNEQLSSVFKP